MGKTDSDLWPQEFADSFSANDKWVAETGEILEKEEVVPHDDGPHTYLSIKFPIRDKDGIVYGVGGISTDITERKHAEDALFFASERVLLATRAAQLGIWDYDVSNNRLVWDDKMYAIYGVAEKEFLGAYEAWEAGLHPEDRARAVEALQVALRRGEPFDSEFRVVWPDGTVRDVEAHAVVLRNGSGDPFRMIGTNCDVTERKRAEEAGRRHTKELQALNRELTAVNEELNQFAYVASHDLQEPLRTIITYSGFLREDIGENLSGDIREDLEILVSAANRMRTLVQDLLQFSRSSKRELEKKACPLDECVEGALHNLQELVNERQAIIVHGELPTVNADKGLITQVIQNIVGNAIKFQKTEAPRVEITAELDHGRWAISVADNGIGIEPQYAKQIFAPFKRLHSAHEYEGSGIGLAVCRKIIERHGGEIWVEPNKEQGSVFKFTLS